MSFMTDGVDKLKLQVKVTYMRQKPKVSTFRVLALTYKTQNITGPHAPSGDYKVILFAWIFILGRETFMNNNAIYDRWG